MSKELIDVVDGNDRFVRKATREEVEEKRLKHRLARVIVVDGEGKLLFQKRSKSKKFWPGCWDIGVTETVMSGESYEAAAIRGLAEELGIVGVSDIQLKRAFLCKISYSSQYNNVFCKVYTHTYSGKLTLQPEEVEEVKFLTEVEGEQLMQKEQVTAGGKITFETYMQKVRGK